MIKAEMEHDQIEFIDQMYEIGWHMRGYLNYDQAWRLSPKERMRAMKYIQDRIKIVEKTKLPLL